MSGQQPPGLRLDRRIYIRVMRLVISWLFNRRTVARLRRRDHVLCLGDSHVVVMRRVRVPGAWFRAYGVGGATASGILNPNSKSESSKRFNEPLRRAPRWQQVLLLLGEVDCGFVIWHRAKRHGLSIDEQLSFTLDSYITFIERIIGQGFSRVLVLSAPLPTIPDSPGPNRGEVANLRVEVTATRLERTELTLQFNAELRERCERIGAVFVDVTSDQLDPVSGVIDARFLGANPRDHHLAIGPYGELITRELTRIWSSPAQPRQAGTPAGIAR